MCFWSDTSARPAFWPDVPYGNIKRSNKESLYKIIHAYLNANDHGEAPSYRDRSPHGSPKTTTRRVEVDVSDDLLSETDQSDIDLSSEPFFPFLQPESTSHQDSQGINEPTPSLANLVRAKPLEPVLQFSPILSEVVRKRSLEELSNKDTFLTDVPIMT